jgi:hypothetical protein
MTDDIKASFICTSFVDILDHIKNYGLNSKLSFLSKILMLLDSLPKEESVKHAKEIHKLRQLIKCFGTEPQDKPLSHKQNDRLQTLVVKSRPIIRKIIKSDTINHSIMYKSCIITRFGDAIYENDIPIRLTSPNDECLMNILLTLLTNISTTVLSSSLSNVVLEYQSSIEALFEFYPEITAYNTVVSEVQDFLISQGWSDSKSSTGFQYEPNKIKLQDGIQQIIDKYGY